MSAGTRRALLWGAVLLGVAAGAAGITGVPHIGAGVLFVAGGLVELTVALLLARRVIRPSNAWGHSSAGMALQGAAWLGSGILFLVLHIDPHAFGVVVGLLPAVLLVVGFRLEHHARARRVTS